MKTDVDAPALDADLVDDQSQQSLSLVKIELVNVGSHRCREADDPLAHGVLVCKFLALGDQGITLLFRNRPFRDVFLCH
ncbi:MAG: hypothetical protein J4F49_09225 [Rhodobacteraceae bacterium]|nr:hypothetical protein [Paracoccaceae bacterium]